MKILDKLNDLHKQATEERSHYYVAGTAKEAAITITRMEGALLSIKTVLVGQHNAVAASIRAMADFALEEGTEQ